MAGEADQRWKVLLVLGIAALAVAVAAAAVSLTDGEGVGPAIAAGLVGLVCVVIALKQREE